VGRGVEVAAPGRLAPSFWMAVTRIAAAGGALASDDEIDVAKVGGGVFATRRGVVGVNSGHGAPQLAGLIGAWSTERSAIGPIDRVRGRAETLPR
jgi:hypothetical protein